MDVSRGSGVKSGMSLIASGDVGSHINCGWYFLVSAQVGKDVEDERIPWAFPLATELTYPVAGADSFTDTRTSVLELPTRTEGHLPSRNPSAL